MPYKGKCSQHDAPLCMTVTKADRVDGLLSMFCAQSYTIRYSKVETNAPVRLKSFIFSVGALY